MTTRHRRGTAPGTCDGPGRSAARRPAAGRPRPGRPPAPGNTGSAR